MKNQIELKELLNVALNSYDTTLLSFNKDYTELRVIDVIDILEEASYYSDLDYLTIEDLTLKYKYDIIIDKSKYTNKLITKQVKDFYKNIINYNKEINRNLTKSYKDTILSFVKQNGYCRFVITKDLKDYLIFNFNERASDEIKYYYTLVINNLKNEYTLKEIKEAIDCFFETKI